MIKRKLSSEVSSAVVWAIFTIGACQLGMVLLGTLASVVALLCCGSLLAVFLSKVQVPARRSLSQIAKPYLLSSGILLAGNLLYVYLVFLGSYFSTLIFFTVLSFVFVIPLLITLPFLRNPSDVSQ